MLRPGQFVRAHILGAMRPKAILVPQRAVQQGGKGHFIWVVNKEGKTEQRPIVVGDWMANDWFINEGLNAGDQVVVDGGLSLHPGELVMVKAQAYTVESAPAGTAPKTDSGKTEAAKGDK
jgi:Membrane-fusion protein